MIISIAFRGKKFSFFKGSFWAGHIFTWPKVPQRPQCAVTLDFPYCKLNTFYLWGKMLSVTTTFKNAQNNSNNLFGKLVSLLPGKRGWVARRIQYDHCEKKNLPSPPTWWVKKHYSLLLSKYELLYIRDGICTGYITKAYHMGVSAVKEDTNYQSRNRSIN